MEDTIEICSGCGKMPRALDNLEGHFICSRCGNRQTMHVSGDNYEKVVTELDGKFHQAAQRKRIEAAASAPVELKKQGKSHKPSKKKAAAKPTKKKVPTKKKRKR